jgi:butyryl-CoA dehydrogenase
MWLKMETAAAKGLAASPGKTDEAFYRGQLAAARFFFAHELPKTVFQSELLCSLDDTNLTTDEAWL